MLDERPLLATSTHPRTDPHPSTCHLPLAHTEPAEELRGHHELLVVLAKSQGAADDQRLMIDGNPIAPGDLLPLTSARVVLLITCDASDALAHHFLERGAETVVCIKARIDAFAAVRIVTKVLEKLAASRAMSIPEAVHLARAELMADGLGLRNAERPERDAARFWRILPFPQPARRTFNRGARADLSARCWNRCRSSAIETDLLLRLSSPAPTVSPPREQRADRPPPRDQRERLLGIPLRSMDFDTSSRQAASR